MIQSASSAATSRRAHWRWFVAAAATAALVVAGSGLVVFAQSGSGESRGPQFVPADASAYIEARLDMPAGQDEALAQFMTAFPGFADAGSFEMKLNQLLDGQIGEMSSGALTYSGQLDQFVTGELGLGLSDFAGAAIEGGQPDMVVGVAVSDTEAAATAVETVMSSMADGEMSQETYGDTAIFTDATTAVAVHDEWILIAPDVAQVTAAIDVLDDAAPSLADDADFAAAFARLPAARLGAAYLDLQSLVPLIEEAMSGVSAFTVGLPTGDLASQLPKDMVASLVAADDRLTVDAFITQGESPMALPVGESDLATRFPADTQLYVETRELGATIETALGTLLASMGAEGTEQLAPIESMLGEPLPTFLDFVSDAGVGGAITSDGLWLGIAAEVTDDELAATRLERILGVVRLFGANAETGVTVEETSIGDESVTVISVPFDELTGGSLPVDLGDSISVALADGTLLIGLGDFVETALTQDAASSLATSEAYTDALGDDTPNSGVAYANVGTLLAGLDPLLGGMIPDWASIAPYATAVDRFIAVGSAADDVISARISVIVDQ